jgi:leucyl aminopeptidase
MMAPAMRAEKYNQPLDELQADLIVVTLYEDERPPRGVNGLIDWRLHGFISRAILSGTIQGKEDESVLIPLQRKLPARRLLVLGLGKPETYDLAKARHTAYRLGKTITQLGAQNVALSFPPAADERLFGETERSVLSAIEQAELPKEVLVRWLDPSVAEH